MATEKIQDSYTDGRNAADVGVEKAFRWSILVSAVRCTLAYVVFPFVAPLLSLASGIEGTIGLVIGLVAIASNVYSIRRYWGTDYRWKVPLSIINVGMIGLVTWFTYEDFLKIFS
jgi:hypothetical protein